MQLDLPKNIWWNFKEEIGTEINETPLPEKWNLYSHLHMEVITNADYTHAKRVCKDFKVKNLGEDHDLYVSTDRLLSADVFNDIRNTYLEKYVFDPANFFFFCIRISMASNRKKEQSEIRSINWRQYVINNRKRF